MLFLYEQFGDELDTGGNPFSAGVVQLVQDGDLVYSAAFSFFESDHGMALGIGCMQGPKGERGLQLIKDATRELHGLRPKNLMVKLLSQFAHDHGCAALRLVSNANRVVCSATRQGKVHADYDTLWQELGAVARSDGDYALASEAICAPDLAAIASKKRSEARKRHETLAALIVAVRAGLHVRDRERDALPLYAARPEQCVDDRVHSAEDLRRLRAGVHTERRLHRHPVARGDHRHDRLVVLAHAVVDDLEELAGEVRLVAVREMAPVREVHRQQLVAGFQEREIDGHVRAAAGVGLHVGVLGSEELLRAVDGKLLDDIHVLTAAVPALLGIAISAIFQEELGFL